MKKKPKKKPKYLIKAVGSRTQILATIEKVK
jgi:hypothetical protein